MIRWRHLATAALVVGLGTGSTIHAAGSDGSTAVAAAVVDAPGPDDAPEPDVPTVPAVVEPSAAVASPPATTMLDPTWNTGFYTSTLVDDEGTTHVAYYADSTATVMLASCTDPCSEPSRRQLADKPGIGTDLTQVGGQLVASFIDLDTRTVQVVSCNVRSCDRVNNRPVAPVAGLGATSVGATPGGDLVVAYPAQIGGLAITRCDGLDCRNPSRIELPGQADHADLTVATDGAVWVAHVAPDGHLDVSRCRASSCERVTSSREVAAFPSIAVAPNGDVAVSYHAATSHTLRAITCPAGAGCGEVTVDDSGDVGYFTAIAIRPDHLPIIGHRSETLPGLVVADCRTPDCSRVAHNVIDASGTPGEHLSVALDDAGRLRLAHHDSTSRTLRLTACAEATCASPPGAEHGAVSLSVGHSPDGTPLVAWRHPDTLDLRLTSCTGGACSDGVAVDSGGDVGLRPSFAASDGRTSVLHQDARDGSLRLVTCDDGCGDPRVTVLDHPGAIVAASSVSPPDGTRELVVTTSDGTIERGTCADADCTMVDWTAIGQRSPDGALAATTTSDGRLAIVHTDDAGAILTVCATTCDTRRFASGTFTAVDLAAARDDIVGVLRDVAGQVSVLRCAVPGCDDVGSVTLAGHHHHVAVGADDGDVTVATVTDAGNVAVFACSGTCVAAGELTPPAPVWRLDLATADGGAAIAGLTASGPWVATCDGAVCSAESTGESSTVTTNVGHQ